VIYQNSSFTFNKLGVAVEPKCCSDASVGILFYIL